MKGLWEIIEDLIYRISDSELTPLPIKLLIELGFVLLTGNFSRGMPMVI